VDKAVAMSIADQTFSSIDSIGADRAQAIRDRLRDAIVDRRLTPGTKLSEGEVGTLFGSAAPSPGPPCRCFPSKGWYEPSETAAPSSPTLRRGSAAGLCFERLIEPGIAVAACGRMSAANVGRVQDPARGRGTPRRRARTERKAIRDQASGDFHLLLSSVAGNVILQRFMEELVARSSTGHRALWRSGVSSCGHLEHVRILDVLENGRAELAGELMLQHIDHIEADLDLRVRSGPALKRGAEL